MICDILQPSKDAYVLDLACGQGRHSLEFARRGFKNIEGLDRSHYLIQRARSVAKSEGLRVRFLEGDARKISRPNDAFDFVMLLGNSFGYFENIHDDLKLLREVFRVLKPWGKLIIDVADGDYLKENFQPRSWEWIDKNHYVCRERSLSADGGRLISREVIAHVNKGVLADQFYAERIYTRDDLKKLLETAGLSRITFHSDVKTQSQRDQDLGMMERRFIVTAQVRKEWSPVRAKAKPSLKNVVVILGDQTKPDVIKPSSRFDDDDLYTIDQLKAALRKNPCYNFTYLDNHNRLHSDLLKVCGKADFVFNLCDEGFSNDARKELHVPALLEILGIKYTGSGPQCLSSCYDKALVRGIAKDLEVPVPRGLFIKPEDTTFELPFSFPVIIKPNLGDSSFGITQRSVAKNSEELVNAISEIRDRLGYEKPVLIEEFLAGADLSLGIIGNPPESYHVLPVIEEDYSKLPENLPRICGYEAKWLSDSPYWKVRSIPANLPEETRQFMVECSLKLFERLECRDYARFDWRLDSEGVPRLLEVNPNPGWCWDGHLAKMAGIAGISYPKMLALILEAAQKRLGLLEGEEAKN